MLCRQTEAWPQPSSQPHQCTECLTSPHNQITSPHRSSEACLVRPALGEAAATSAEAGPATMVASHSLVDWSTVCTEGERGETDETDNRYM